MPGPLYSDKDGAATEASQLRYSNLAAKLSLAVGLLAGLVCSVLLLVRDILNDPKSPWPLWGEALSAAWVGP